MNQPPYNVLSEHDLPDETVKALSRLLSIAHSGVSYTQYATRLVRVAQGTAQSYPTIGSLFQEALNNILTETREQLEQKAREYLATINREQHLLNLYVALNHTTMKVECVWKFDDLSTALMFKLSLS